MKRVLSLVLVLGIILSVFACSFAANAEMPVLPLDGSVISGSTIADSHYVNYAFKLEKRGVVNFAIVADKKLQLFTLRNEETGEYKSVVTFTAADFKESTLCEKAANMYLEAGSYSIEIYGVETAYSVSATFKECDFLQSGYTLSANKTSKYMANEWSTPKSHKLIVKKPYRIIFTVEHNMPIALNVKDAAGNVYLKTTKYTKGTADKAVTDTVILNLKKARIP